MIFYTGIINLKKKSKTKSKTCGVHTHFKHKLSYIIILLIVQYFTYFFSILILSLTGKYQECVRTHMRNSTADHSRMSNSLFKGLNVKKIQHIIHFTSVFFLLKFKKCYITCINLNS